MTYSNDYPLLSKSALKSLITFVLLCAPTIMAQNQTPCTLVVPENPLSAKGLSTPYLLAGNCKQSDPNTQSFVEATILEPATGKLFAYSPLVITQGTKPAAAPVVPKLPPGAVVGLWFGSNAANLQLVDSKGSLKQGACVNGVPGSIFGQFASCNGAQFFADAKKAIAAGKIKIPALGKAKDGSICPTTRSFAVVDQDQSDNVITQYLQLGETTAQVNAANKKKLKDAKPIANGSDNALLADFLNPALGCKSFNIPTLDDPGNVRPTLATNELQAMLQMAPVALVPSSDPMVLNNLVADLRKVNTYRILVGQPIAKSPKDADPVAYCQSLAKIAPPVIQRQKALTVKQASPVITQANTLFTFLGSRFSASFASLGCQAMLGFKSPITPVLDGNGVAVDLTFNIQSGKGNGNGKGKAKGKGKGKCTGKKGNKGAKAGKGKGKGKGKKSPAHAKAPATPAPAPAPIAAPASAPAPDVASPPAPASRRDMLSRRLI